MNKQIGKSIWAVLAGVLTIIIVTTLVDIALHVAGVFAGPDVPLTDALSLLASSYRLVISIGGAYLTAKLAPDRPLGLSPALHVLAARRRYLALSIAGRRYDIGAPYGLLLAQLALSLSGRDRDQVLTQIVELLAVRTH